MIFPDHSCNLTRNSPKSNTGPLTHQLSTCNVTVGGVRCTFLLFKEHSQNYKTKPHLYRYFRKLLCGAWMAPGIVIANHKPSVHLHATPWLESPLSNPNHNEGQPQTTLRFSNSHSYHQSSSGLSFPSWLYRCWCHETADEDRFSQCTEWGGTQNGKLKTQLKHINSPKHIVFIQYIQHFVVHDWPTEKYVPYKLCSFTTSVHEQTVLSSSCYNETGAFLHSAAYILPTEFTIMECSLFCPKQLITKRCCPQLQPSPFASSSSRSPFMSLIDPLHPEWLEWACAVPLRKKNSPESVDCCKKKKKACHYKSSL